MEAFYNSLRPGDLIYVLAVVSLRGRLALCRIVEIRKYKSRPDYIEFFCEILQQWFPGYGPLRWFGKRLTVGCSIGFAYSGMWHLYSVQDFERTHDAVREKRTARDAVRAKRKKRA
jgi:hypothetical protein